MITLSMFLGRCETPFTKLNSFRHLKDFMQLSSYKKKSFFVVNRNLK